MKKFILLLLGCIILNSACTSSNNKTTSKFEFPKSKMGEFAKDWFNFINSEKKEYILQYDKEREWEEHLTMMKSISQRVDGITPYLISYETEDFISIYSKENKGSWVIVNLGLNSANEITATGIKKTFKPVDYDLRTKLTKDKVKEIVNEISENLRTNYVIKKSGSKFASQLTDSLNKGTYNSITQGDLLATILTKNLVALSNDKHLQIIPPGRVSEVEKRFGLDSNNASTASHDTSQAEEETISSKLLENNIGYISIQRFVDDEKTANATKNALLGFSNTRAIIIDLRYSGGGDAGAVVDLMSYFLPEDELLGSFPEMVKNKEVQNLPDEELRSPFLKKPLYVLTGSKTISAGEALAYYLQKKKRATIIGEKTAGAGYRVDVFELPYGFFFVNSIFTSFDTEKGEGWQGTGVTPDSITSSAKALDVALSTSKTN